MPERYPAPCPGSNLVALTEPPHLLAIRIEPDLTFLIDLDPAAGLSRAVGRRGHEQRFEDMGLAMQERMRAGFLGLARKFPERIAVVEGSGGPEVVAGRVRETLRDRLGR